MQCPTAVTAATGRSPGALTAWLRAAIMRRGEGFRCGAAPSLVLPTSGRAGARLQALSRAAHLDLGGHPGRLELRVGGIQRELVGGEQC